MVSIKVESYNSGKKKTLFLLMEAQQEKTFSP